MPRRKKKTHRILFRLIAFALFSIPFTLVKIGNLTEWLIKILWRAVVFFLLLSLSFLRIGLYLVTWNKPKVRKLKKSLAHTLRRWAKSFFRTLKDLGRSFTRTIRKTVRFLCLLVPRRWRYFMAGVSFTFIFIFLPYQAYAFLKNLPNPILLTQRIIPVTTKIFDRNGQLLYEIYADQNRTPLSLTTIPTQVKQATIAVEDQEFYNHPGFSPRGIARAFWETFANHNLQGGSTITQQLIKNALLTPELTFSRKLQEIILAFWAERLFSKDQILEMYLNQVPYGGTSWGIESAAQTYFGKSATQVSLAEAALLAGLPAAPTTYSPFGDYPQLAKIRQREVLEHMVEMGYITKKEEEEAINEKLSFARPNVPIKAPHFVMYVRDVLAQRYGLRAVEQGGLRVTTTIDLATQDMVQDVVTTEVEKLAPLLVGNGAAVVANPKTGEILAMVGGRNYFDTGNSGNVNVTTALRQPGSSIKVVNYAAALEHGFTATSLLNDSPVIYRYAGGPAYSPVNYDGRYHGLVTLRSALANSYNIPAVKVLASIGVQTMVDKGRLMGITSWNDTNRFGLSLTLGGGDVTMLDMMTVYSTLAHMGLRSDLTPLLEVTNYRGEELERIRTKPPVQAVSPEVAFIISDILADNAARTPAFGPNSSLVIPGKNVSVKTGTSNEKRDNLTYGYTPSYVVGVWVGNNDGRPMHPTLTSGITGAAPIWHEIMVRLLANKTEEKFAPPANLITVTCGGRLEYYVRGTEPSGGCIRIPTAVPQVTPGINH